MEGHDAHTTPIYNRALILPELLHASDLVKRVIHQEALVVLARPQGRSSQHPMLKMEMCLGSHMSPSSGPRLTPSWVALKLMLDVESTYNQSTRAAQAMTQTCPPRALCPMMAS